MSVIQTIRNKYLGLMVALIVIALVGFLVMDGLQSNAGNLFGGRGDASTVAEINGRKFNISEFTAMKELAVSNLKASNPKATEAEIKEAEAEAWQQFMSDKLMDVEFERLGMKFTDKEFQDMLTGQFPAQFIKNNFKNEQGLFDPNAVKQYTTQVRANRKKDAKSEQAYAEWLKLEDQLIRERMVQKYTGMIGLGVYQPLAASKAMFKEREGVSSISYVMVPYDSVKDNITVADADYQAYIQKYRGAFEVEQELRAFDYVSWDIIPTAEDTANSLGKLNSLAAEFASASNYEEFIGKHGDDAYDNVWHAAGGFVSPAIDSLMSRPVGSVVGPFYDNGAFRLAKVLDKANLYDSVKISAIPIPITETRSDDDALALADSIKRVANAGNFASLVNTYGDEQTKAKGGDIGFINVSEGSNSNELFTFLQTAKTGQVGRVKQGNAYVVVLVTDVKAPKNKAKIATLTKYLRPSKSTLDAVYAKVNSAMTGVKDKASFEKAIKANGLTKRVVEACAETQSEVDGLSDAREVVRYAFNNEVGSVSGIMSLGTNKYVVCLVTNKYGKGLAPVALVRQSLQQELIRQKKYEIIAAKYKGKGLDAIAAATGQQVQVVDSVLAYNMQGTLSQEPKVLGAAFNKANVGKVSEAIYGKNGVYYVTVKNIGTRSLGATDEVYKQEQQMYVMQNMQNFGRSLPQILRRRYKVVDNRGKFM